MLLRDAASISTGGYCDAKDQLKQHVYARSLAAFKAGDDARDAIKTPEALKARAANLRKRLINEALGGLPSMDTPLNAKVMGKIEEAEFTIEKIIYESRPNAFVTANLYIPANLKGKTGAVLFVCGHGYEAKGYTTYQTCCRYMAKAGLVVLAVDCIGQGERISYYEPSIGQETIRCGTGEHDYVGAQSLFLGDSLAKYFVHDDMRGVDYLLTRPEVNPDKIGVTGNSGGGTQTSLMMMCDDRVAAAAPTTFIMNRESYMLNGGCQDAEQIWPNMSYYGFDHEDILLMMCPKPVQVQAVLYDFFPFEGTTRTFERSKRFYEMFGVSEHLILKTDVSGHKYTRKLAKDAAYFFAKHLNGVDVELDDEGIEPIPDCQLWCTKSGQIRGELDGVRMVYEENIDRVDEFEKLRKSVSKEDAMSWLKSIVFADRKPCEFNMNPYRNVFADNLKVDYITWKSQDKINNNAAVIRDFEFIGKDIPIAVGLWTGGVTKIANHSKWIRKQCAEGKAVVVLELTGTGSLMPHNNQSRELYDFYGVTHTLTTHLLWIKDNLAALRVWDVIRFLDVLPEFPNVDTSNVTFTSFGNYGVYFKLAKALDSRIKNLETNDLFESFAELVKTRHYDNYDFYSIIIPDVLKYLDLPELDN